MKDKNIEVLKVLIERSEEQININRLSKILRIDYKNTYNIVKRLSKDGLVSLKKFGKAINCILNKKNHPLIFEAEHARRNEVVKNNNIKLLQEKLNRLPFSLAALIFGSYAKKKTGKGSDIDLLLVCEKERIKEVESTVSLIPLKIHLTTITPEEFIKMAKSKEFSIVSEAIKNNIILVGIEDYYRLIENVK